MIKSLIKILCLMLFFFATSSFANEFCSKEIVNQNLTGIWEGGNTYYFQIRVDRDKHLCISIVEDGSATEREIRDVIIVDGKLKHFSYYTPSTDGYVIHANIKISNNKMSYNLFSSFNNQSREGSYSRIVNK